MRTNILVYSMILLLSACSTIDQYPGQSGPIVDTQGMDMNRYYTDLAECEALAKQVPVGERAATDAVVGAAVGGAVGAILGGSDSAAKGAGIGAVGGTVKGAGSGIREQEQVVRNCLRGRGYRVLN